MGFYNINFSQIKNSYDGYKLHGVVMEGDIGEKPLFGRQLRGEEDAEEKK